MSEMRPTASSACPMVLAALCCALLWAAPAAKAQEDAPLVVASTSVLADMAAVVGGNLVRVQSIVPRGSDPHRHEATPADARLLAGADLILENGLMLEGWLAKVIVNSDTRARRAVLTEGITPITSDAYPDAMDPHAWMTATNGMVYIKNIRDALVELMPAHEQEFDFNYRYYKRQLEDADAAIRQEIGRIPAQQRVLITSHDAFRYYGNQYGLRVESVLGTSTDADVRTADVIRLNKTIAAYRIPALFVEVAINPKLLRQVAQDNGIAIGGHLFSDSLGEAGGEAGTYLDLLLYNTATISAALRGEAPAQPIEPAGGRANVPLAAALLLMLAGSFAIMYTQLSPRL